MDESFVAKLLDVGEDVEFAAGATLLDPDEPTSDFFLIRSGEVEVDAGGEVLALGAGNVVGARILAERYGLADARATAVTAVRALAVDPAAYEAALTG